MKKTIISLLALTISLTATAQMDNVVEVEDAYRPTVKDANKVNVMPQTETTPVKHYNVEYTNNISLARNYQFQPTTASQSDATLKGEPKNFITLAGGNAGNVVARGAYGLEFTSNDILNLDFSLRGHNQDVDIYDNDLVEWKQRYYTTKGAINYEHRINTETSVIVDGGLESQVFNYQHDNSTSTPLSTTDKQHNWLLGVGAQLTPLNIQQFTVGGNIGFKRFSRRDIHEPEVPSSAALYYSNEREAESELNARINSDYHINKTHSLGIDLGVKGISYSHDDYDSQTAFNIMPHYTYTDEKMDIRLGAKLIFESGLSSKFHVVPDAYATFRLDPKTELFAEATGGVIFNDYWHYNTMTPYWILPSVQQEAQFNQICALLGVKFKVNEGLFAKLYGGYENCNNRAELTLPTGELYTNSIITADGSLVHFNAEVLYDYQDKVHVEAHGRYNGWSIKKSNGYYNSTPAWRPTVEGGASLSFQPLTGLRIGIDYDFAVYPNDDKVIYKRPMTNELGASISYKIPKGLLPANISVYAKANNLINEKYDWYYGCKSIGTSVIAGVAVNF